MSDKLQTIDGDTGEVYDTFLVPVEGPETLDNLIPYNKMTNIARQTLVRIKWNSRTGKWESDMGDSNTLSGVLVKAAPLYAVWTDQLGKPSYLGFSPPENPTGEVSTGYRLAINSEEFGPCYCDMFGIVARKGSAACKVADKNPENRIKFNGSEALSTEYGTFYSPMLVK